jgi:3-ketoacyl-CoA synthase
MLVNKFKFRNDVESYHLGGMGCGNGVMAMSLLRNLLQVRGRRGLAADWAGCS